MANKNILFLFRNDLRIQDNPALYNAISQIIENKSNKIIIAYIYDNKSHEKVIGSASKWFLYNALKSLAKDLKAKYNLDINYYIGLEKSIINNLVTSHDISEIYLNKVYEPFFLEQDKLITEELEKRNVKIFSYNSSLLFEPWSIKNVNGGYFKVFTPFWKSALTGLKNIRSVIPVLKNQDLSDNQINENTANGDFASNIDLLNLIDKKYNWSDKFYDFWQVSEQHALNMLENFVENKINNYKEQRDIPAIESTSKLSAYLHFGLISPNQIYDKIISYFGSNEITSGAECFLSEIGWREFSYHLLNQFPALQTKNFNPKFDNFIWDNDLEKLKLWQKGKTGYPIIDAAMQELWQTGWMHNRMRMVVASFLVKNLLIDWRYGEKWFADCLVDFDLASNSASWQWVAGSGADAAPYFRIFNPILQSQKFDPNGHYIKKWLPKLGSLDKNYIHQPNFTNDMLGYQVKPIVDISISRGVALERYKNCSNDI